MGLFEVVTDSSEILRLPYRAGSGKGDTPNIGFAGGVLENPELIDTFPEIAGFPELRELLYFLHEPNGSFRSLRIDSSLEAPLFEPFTHSVYAMITFVFRDAQPGQVDEPTYRQYYDHLMWLSNGEVSDQVRCMFRVVPVETSNFSSVALEIRVFGTAFSESDARAQWVMGMEHLRKCIEMWDLKERDLREV